MVTDLRNTLTGLQLLLVPKFHHRRRDRIPEFCGRRAMLGGNGEELFGSGEEVPLEGKSQSTRHPL